MAAPADLVGQVATALTQLPSLAAGTPERERSSAELDQCLGTMKLIIYGEHQQEPDAARSDELRAALVRPETDCLRWMIIHHEQAAFESRKVIALLVSHLLRKFPQAVPYVQGRPDTLDRLTAGYSNPDVALTCGGMLRECLRHEDLCMQVAESPEMLGRLVEAVQLPNFDLATDAFGTFKELLTLHKTARFAAWMDGNYDALFSMLNKLHRSVHCWDQLTFVTACCLTVRAWRRCENYVTRRLTMKLLGEILLDRNNFKVVRRPALPSRLRIAQAFHPALGRQMSRYIADPRHLRLVMKALADPSQAIAFEAFHVFKIFAANPNKTKEVEDILLRNRVRCSLPFPVALRANCWLRAGQTPGLPADLPGCESRGRPAVPDGAAEGCR